MKLKKLKKIPAFIAFIIIFIFGYLCLQIIPPLLYNDNSGALDKVDCPQYINEFVDKNPQAIELKENYQPNENTDPIILDSPNGIPLYIQWDKRWACSALPLSIAIKYSSLSRIKGICLTPKVTLYFFIV